MFVPHDLGVAAEIVVEGPVADVLARPAHPYTAALRKPWSCAPATRMPRYGLAHPQTDLWSRRMTAIPDDEATLRSEFDALAKRAGLAIPDDRREWLFAGFKDLRRELPLLRQPRTAASEPAAVYTMDSIIRTIAP